MSGLLQRLALRALGRPPAIRPIVRQGWAAVNSDSSLDADRPAENNALLAQPDPVTRDRRETATDAPPDASVPASAAAARQKVELPSPPLVATVRRSAAHGSPADVESRVHPDPVDGEVVSEPRSLDHGPAHTAFGPDAFPAEPFTPALDSTQPRTRSPSGPSSARRSPARAGSALAARASAWPEPPRPPSMGETTRGMTQPAPEAITEVHVTIGRIELTAAPAAAAPRREAARKRQPQSLEAYLARREASRR
jgi:hypothetical protein